MRSTHDYTDLVNDWLTSAGQVRIVMSRLKLKVNNSFTK